MTEGISLAGKIALVAGAGRGIGQQIALRLARDGARLIVRYSGKEAAVSETMGSIREEKGVAFAVAG